MEKDRKIKILSIVALVLAITGMSLGFAAFSSTLTISSSATVTPNSDDFNLTIYGISDYVAWGDFLNSLDFSLLSTTISSPTLNPTSSSAETTATTAIINNDTMTLSNISVTFSKPSIETANYYFVLKNTGKYTAYMNLNESEIGELCTWEENTTESLAEQACNSIYWNIYTIDNQGNQIEFGTSPILPNDWQMLLIEFKYPEGSVLPDGNIKYEVRELKLPYTTTPQ